VGKGDTNAKFYPDVNGIGTKYEVELSIHDDCTLAQRDGLITAAGTSQASLDNAASAIWDWYSARPVIEKQRLRICILASQKSS